MLPQRLDTMTKTMVAYGADLGLHSYLGASGCCHSPPRITTPAVAASLYANMTRCRHRHFRTRCTTEQAPLACRLADTCSTSRCAHSTSCIHFLPGSLQRVHYAHATVRGSVFERLRQREAAEYGKVLVIGPRSYPLTHHFAPLTLHPHPQPQPQPQPHPPPPTTHLPPPTTLTLHPLTLTLHPSPFTRSPTPSPSHLTSHTSHLTLTLTRITHLSSITHHLSPLTSHLSPSPLTAHRSPPHPSPSRLTAHLSPLTLTLTRSPSPPGNAVATARWRARGSHMAWQPLGCTCTTCKYHAHTECTYHMHIPHAHTTCRWRTRGSHVTWQPLGCGSLSPTKSSPEAHTVHACIYIHTHACMHSMHSH